jgi:hypothetical protein
MTPQLKNRIELAQKLAPSVVLRTHGRYEIQIE